jgi:hypothetical protein
MKLFKSLLLILVVLSSIFLTLNAYAVTNEYFNSVIGYQCDDASSNAIVFFKDQERVARRINLYDGKIENIDEITDFKDIGNDLYSLAAKNRKGQTLNDVILFKNNQYRLIGRDVDGKKYIVDGANLSTGMKTGFLAVCQPGSPLHVAITQAWAKKINEKVKLQKTQEYSIPPELIIAQLKVEEAGQRKLIETQEKQKKLAAINSPGLLKNWKAGIEYIWLN